MRIENISGTMLRIHGMKVAPGREATIEAGRVPPGFRTAPGPSAGARASMRLLVQLHPVQPGRPARLGAHQAGQAAMRCALARHGAHGEGEATGCGMARGKDGTRLARTPRALGG